MLEDSARNALRESWRLVSTDTRALTERFYRRLFELAPEIRPLFPDDLRELRKKLAETLRALVFGLDSLSTLLMELSRLGERHAAYGAVAEHYPVVGAALIDALREQLGDRFTAQHEAAWAEVLEFTSGVMINAQKSATA